MKYSLTLLIFLCISSWAYSQIISSFPYEENFDSFPESAIPSPFLEPNPDLFPGNWVNNIIGDGAQDWYGWSGNTPSVVTGPSKDHTTGSGVYLYVEDSGTGANNDAVTLESPTFDISSLSNPIMAVWVHSLADTLNAFYGGDTSLNHMFIEVQTGGGSWTVLDSIGDLQADWTEKAFDLSPFSGLIKFRFRVNNNNLGDFIHDIAIDDFSVIDLPEIDGALVETNLLSPPYTIVPFSQNPSYELSGTIKNLGAMPLTNLKLTASKDAFLDSVFIDSLPSFQTANVTIPGMLSPGSTGPVSFILSTHENDTFQLNNTAIEYVVDTVFARDDSLSEGGLGFSGTSGFFGNMFELTQGDTLTSSSFFLDAGTTAGDSMRIILQGFGNEIANSPDTSAASVIATTEIFVIPSGGGWFTLPFSCPAILSPGTYFIAVEQINSTSVSLGYDLDNYESGTTFFNNGFSGWAEISLIPELASALLLRMNFGPANANLVNEPAPAVCVGDPVTVSGIGSGMFTWSGPGLTDTTTTTLTIPNSMFGTYQVSRTDTFGCTRHESFELNLNPLPLADITGDTLACAGSQISLTGTGGGTYLWSNGSMDTTITITTDVDTTFSVEVTSDPGCSANASISISAIPSPSVTLDSTLAIGGVDNGTATASPTGGNPPYTFVWSDPSMQTTATASGLAPGTYLVTVTDSLGCSVTDSIEVTEAPSGIHTLAQNLITLSPNPTRGEFTISNLKVFGDQQKLSLILYDITGKISLHIQEQGQDKINVHLPDHFPNGLYLLDIRSDETRVVKRVILER